LGEWLFGGGVAKCVEAAAVAEEGVGDACPDWDAALVVQSS
jgi:hypothetical protein